jgi:hypothetical protein
VPALTPKAACVLAGVAVIASLGVAGCRGCEPDLTGVRDAPHSAEPAPAAKVGVLTGSVRLAPGAVLPSYPAELMERKVLSHVDRGTFPESCTPPKLADRMPVRMTPDGKLIGVMVTASDFSKNPERAPRTYDVTIKDCRLTPPLVVAMKGDKLRVRNEVNFPFMPTLGQSALTETLTPGQTNDNPLDQPGVSAVLCGFTAPCGRTDVVVLFHPLYAITDENGNFRIENFPADEAVHVNAWHPLFIAQEQGVKLERGATKNLDFVIAPTGTAQPTGATSQPASASKP